MECKICGKTCKNNRSLGAHLSKVHNTSLHDYSVEYEGFEIPKCVHCGKQASYKGSLTYYKTCGSKECLSKEGSLRKHSSKTKEKIRRKRLSYMKANPEDTAWRLGNEPSWGEKIFMKALERHGWLEKHTIVREKSFYPFYADFAFKEAKLVVEIDGSQHKVLDRKKKDKKKDDLIKSKGWRIYRVSSSIVQNNVEEVIKELENFIGSLDYGGYTSKIVTDASIKKAKKELIKEKLLLKRASLVVKRRNLLDESGINVNSWGGITKVANLWKVSHTQARRFIKKFYPDIKI